jgi:hypothetical protein
MVFPPAAPTSRSVLGPPSGARCLPRCWVGAAALSAPCCPCCSPARPGPRKCSGGLGWKPGGSTSLHAVRHTSHEAHASLHACGPGGSCHSLPHLMPCRGAVIESFGALTFVAFSFLGLAVTSPPPAPPRPALGMLDGWIEWWMDEWIGEDGDGREEGMKRESSGRMQSPH